MGGPAGIIGCPGSGKTSLARELAIARQAETGVPLVIIDTGRNEMFDDLFHEASLDDVLAAVWGDGDHATWTPGGPEEFEAFCAALYETAEDARKRRAQVQLPAILIDEYVNVLGPSKRVGFNFGRCLREHRRTVSGFWGTSQLYHDGGNALHGLASEWYIHRMTGPEDLKDIRADRGLEPDLVAALPSRKECAEAGRPLSPAYVYLKVGF